MASGSAPAQDAFAALLRKQDLVVSRCQALEQGLTPAKIKYRIRRDGPWQRLLPGIYLTATGTPTAAQQEIAALLYAGASSVITGLGALRHHGMRVKNGHDLTLLVPATRPREDRPPVKIWPTTRMPERICFDGPVRYALPPRAVADAARAFTSFRQVRGLVADAVQQGLCRPDWLHEELAHGPVRHSAWLRQSLAEVMDGIRSGAEGDFRDLVRRAGLPLPVFNARICVGTRLIAVADAWWPQAGVAAEVESREWHLSPDDWAHTLRRSARLSAHGIVVLHFTPGQIRDEPDRVAADVKAALANGRPWAAGPAEGGLS